MELIPQSYAGQRRPSGLALRRGPGVGSPGRRPGSGRSVPWIRCCPCSSMSAAWSCWCCVPSRPPPHWRPHPQAWCTVTCRSCWAAAWSSTDRPSRRSPRSRSCCCTRPGGSAQGSRGARRSPHMSVRPCWPMRLSRSCGWLSPGSRSRCYTPPTMGSRLSLPAFAGRSSVATGGRRSCRRAACWRPFGCSGGGWRAALTRPCSPTWSTCSASW